MNYEKNYFGRVFNALSQLGNAISGGSADVSISARVGYMRKKNIYWITVNSIIDFTFFPIDGQGHCSQAYASDTDENYRLGMGNIIGTVLMTTLLTLACFALMPFTWLYHLLTWWIVK